MLFDRDTLVYLKECALNNGVRYKSFYAMFTNVKIHVFSQVICKQSVATFGYNLVCAQYIT